MKKETTTIVRVKPTSDPDITFVAFTVCPAYHIAYKKETLKKYNITVDDYRYGSVWYPTEDIPPKNGREFFHEVTYEIHEVIEKIVISTMSLNRSKIEIEMQKELDRKYVKFTTQYVDTYGRCYTMNATEGLLRLGVKNVAFITRMGVYVFLDHPGQHLHGNSRSKVICKLR